MTTTPNTPGSPVPASRPARAPRGAGRRRQVARLLHLVAAAALGAFVYAPADLVEPVRLLLQVVVVPAATLTGLYLWKQAALRRWWARRTGSAARRSHRPPAG